MIAQKLFIASYKAIYKYPLAMVQHLTAKQPDITTAKSPRFPVAQNMYLIPAKQTNMDTMINLWIFKNPSIESESQNKSF